MVKNTLSYLYLASINLMFLFYRNVSTLRSSNKNRSETYQGNTRQPVMLHILHCVSKVISFRICKWRCIKLYSAFYLLKRIAIKISNELVWINVSQTIRFSFSWATAFWMDDLQYEYFQRPVLVLSDFLCMMIYTWYSLLKARNMV